MSFRVWKSPLFQGTSCYDILQTVTKCPSPRNLFKKLSIGSAKVWQNVRRLRPSDFRRILPKSEEWLKSFRFPSEIRRVWNPGFLTFKDYFILISRTSNSGTHILTYVCVHRRSSSCSRSCSCCLLADTYLFVSCLLLSVLYCSDWIELSNLVPDEIFLVYIHQDEKWTSMIWTHNTPRTPGWGGGSEGVMSHITWGLFEVKVDICLIPRPTFIYF